MTQMQFILYFYGFPALCGLILSGSLWKLKKSYIVAIAMIVIAVIWYFVLSNINTHGSEGPGLLLLLYSSFTFVPLISFFASALKRITSLYSSSLSLLRICSGTS